MKIVLEAEDQEEAKLLGVDKLEIKKVGTYTLVCRTYEKGIPQDISRSSGNEVEWLVGRLYAVLQIVKYHLRKELGNANPPRV